MLSGEGYWPNEFRREYGDTRASVSATISNPVRLKFVSESGSEIVSTANLKVYAKIEHSEDDTLIASLGVAARKMIEKFLNRSLMAQTWDIMMDRPPVLRYVELPRSPVATVTHIKTYATDNTATTLASTNYVVDTYSSPSRVFLNPTVQWCAGSLRDFNGFELRFVTSADDNEVFQTAIKRTVAYMYEHREDATDSYKLSDGVKAMISSYRISSL